MNAAELLGKAIALDMLADGRDQHALVDVRAQDAKLAASVFRAWGELMSMPCGTLDERNARARRFDELMKEAGAV